MQQENRPDRWLLGPLVRPLRQVACRLRGLFRRNEYRPEKHYMRGPGPKAAAPPSRCGRR